MEKSKSSIVPFRLVRYNAQYSYKLVMTNRAVKTIRLNRSRLSSAMTMGSGLNARRASESKGMSRSTMKPLKLFPSGVYTVPVSENKTVVPLPVNVKWEFIPDHGNAPQAREGASLLSIGDCLYLFGGMSGLRLSEILKFSPATRSWSKVPAQNDPPGKLGHSAVVCSKNIVIFGGYTDNKMGLRECTSKMHVFSVRNKKWVPLQAVGFVPTARRNHSACLLGKSMLVYGGVTSHSKVLEDLLILNVLDKKWTQVPQDRPWPGPRSHASFSLVIQENIDENTEIELEDVWEHYDWENRGRRNYGFYLFGGLNERWEPTNQLLLLQGKHAKFSWKQMIPVGVPPRPRFGHTAAVMNEKLYIFGGRNDACYSARGNALSDLFIFSTLECLWEEVKVEGDIPGSRWGHCMAQFQNKIFIFGGMNYRQYQPPQLYAASIG